MELNEYQILITKVKNPLDSDSESEVASVYTSTESALSLLLNFLNIIRSEIDRQVSSEELHESQFEKVRNSIFQEYRMRDLKSLDNIEPRLKKYIKKLKDEDLHIITEKIYNDLVKLRGERIKFWEWILENYRKDKDNYNVELKKIYDREL